LFLFHGNASKCIERVVNVTLLFLMILFFYSAASAMAWIKHYVPDADVPLKDQATSKAVAEALKDGIVLCQLANALECEMAFKQMENIGKYLEATYEYGVSKNDSFQTVDLYEVQNMAAVINGIHALGRKAGTKGKLGIGPKESQQNKREFTEEQLRAGDGVIGLQMGSNKGASQAGQNFGKTRSIID